ncbi:MAG: hypothetical protein NZL87_07415 [Thermomicrobium sp.]|nr:hypothetical protein [Thermomicrobium sp.]MCS7246457.1 hypothetical protein [Thermomicrobium sp.]MDW7982829.1 hypothetical protein [Thermomicrobium sp.]
MSTSEDEELYRLLVDMEELEELLELLEEYGLTTLDQLAERLRTERDADEQVERIRALAARGLRTHRDLEQELARLEASVSETGSLGSEWVTLN